MSAPTKMPTFVPRVALASERAATRIARRVASPIRTVSARVLGFADRLVGGWLGGFSYVPAGRGAQRAGGSFVMPRPWYDVDGPAMVGRGAAPQWLDEAETPTFAETTVAQVAPLVAERGAAITRTQVEAPAPRVLSNVPAEAPVAP